LRVARRWPALFLARTVCRYRSHSGSFLAGLERRRGRAEFEVAQANFLRRELGDGDARERAILGEGLAFRAAMALLQAMSAMRRGEHAEGRRWLHAASTIAGGWKAFAGIVPLAIRERRRIARGLDPPLLLDPAPEAPQ